jgi:hypothetical protein
MFQEKNINNMVLSALEHETALDIIWAGSKAKIGVKAVTKKCKFNPLNEIERESNVKQLHIRRRLKNIKQI